MKKEPTDAQKDIFWKWCGWGYMPGIGLISPDGEDIVPPIDLNSLFKYAVPKLDVVTIDFQSNSYMAWVVYKGKSCITHDKNPALALFQAIMEVIKENK